MSLRSDKEVERSRYDRRAQLGTHEAEFHLPAYLWSPYEFFIKLISMRCGPGVKVLELASGVGQYSQYVLNTGADLVATDISASSVLVMRRRFSDFENFSSAEADIESLGFSSESFDVVIMAGVLSYGDLTLVSSEIRRVLKKGGYFLSVDSLDHNWIYRFNRLLHYIRGRRSLSTLRRMPTLGSLKKLEGVIGSCDSLHFFGKFSWLGPVVSSILGDRAARIVIDRLDAMPFSDSLAFKFVISCRKT